MEWTRFVDGSGEYARSGPLFLVVKDGGRWGVYDWLGLVKRFQARLGGDQAPNLVSGKQRAEDFAKRMFITTV